jgi:phosphoenolpyruvate-protein kinase (PTS system EI component)
MRYTGMAVVPGISRGQLWAPQASDVDDARGIEAFEAARKRFIAEAAALPDDLRATYEAIVDDPVWNEGVERHLASSSSLTAAIAATAREIAATLETIADPYLRARASDFVQIGAQLIRLLGDVESPEPETILCARDVSAVELAQWSPKLVGVVLIDVAPTAHVAIVARGLALPTIAVADDAEGLYETAQRARAEAPEPSVLNGFEGWLETGAPPELVDLYPPQRISAEPDSAPVNLGGRAIGVFANVNFPDDAAFAAALGADGVGLLRTEFLYVDRPAPPPFDEERSAYERVAAAFRGRPIVVRTLDLGGDKIGLGIDRDGLDHGMLGVRGIRLSLRRPDEFSAHVRAILEGFWDADMRLMFPMVAVPDEFAQARSLVADVARRSAKKMPPLGIMLEVPAAAYALEAFARAGVSFISLGTNDLSQYFFASDRLSVANAIDPMTSEAFRSFVRDTIARAKRAGLEVGVCGEAASSAAMTSLWIESGVDELSVSPGLVPWLKSRLRNTHLEAARGSA